MNWIIVFCMLIRFIDGKTVKNEISNVDNSFQTSDAKNSLDRLKNLLSDTKFAETNNPPANNKEESQKDLLDILSKVTSGTTSVSSEVQSLYDNSNQLKKVPKDETPEQKEQRESKISKQKKQIDLAIGVANGLSSVVMGVRDMNYLNVVTGTLGMISSLLMFTGPQGAVLGSVLSLISFGISAFFAKEQKSQSQIILEGVEKIIKEVEEEKLSVITQNYFKEMYIRELSIKDLLKIDNPDQDQRNAIEMFFKEMMEKIIVESGSIFTTLKNKVATKCPLIQNADCNECLSLIQKYFTLSIRKQIFALHLVGLYEKLLPAPNFASINTYDELKRRMKEMTNDCQMYLNYLLKANSDFGSKKCVAQYYKYPGKFNYIETFLKHSIENIAPDTVFSVRAGENSDFVGDYDNFELKNVDQQLYEFPLAGRRDEWLTKLRTLFVPPKYEVILQPGSTKILGPTVVEVDDKTYAKIIVRKNDQLSGEYIRYCKDKKMDGTCIQIDTKGLDPKRIFNIESFSPKSLYIPSGWKVDIKKKVEIPSGLGSSMMPRYATESYQNIKGPNILDYICKENGYIIQLSSFSKITPSKNEVKICSDKDFSGWCDYIDTNVNGNVIHSCKWNTIQSYSVPNTLKLKVKTKGWFGTTDRGLTKSSNNADLTSIENIQVIDFPNDKKLKKQKKVL